MLAGQSASIMSSTRGWRRLASTEECVFNYEEDPNLERGYFMGARVFLHGHGHGTCGCLRCRHPEVVRFFFPHINEFDGDFPSRARMEHHGWMIEQLQERAATVGFNVGWTQRNISYGQLRSSYSDEAFRIRMLCVLQRHGFEGGPWKFPRKSL